MVESLCQKISHITEKLDKTLEQKRENEENNEGEMIWPLSNYPLFEHAKRNPLKPKDKPIKQNFVVEIMDHLVLYCINAL